MSNKADILELVGIVEEVLPSNMFRVRVEENGHGLTAYLGGRLKQNKIKVITGDRVRLEVSAYDLNKGRIVYRM
jgi:translation initiation factor IF-1